MRGVSLPAASVELCLLQERAIQSMGVLGHGVHCFDDFAFPLLFLLVVICERLQ